MSKQNVRDLMQDLLSSLDIDLAPTNKNLKSFKVLLGGRKAKIYSSTWELTLELFGTCEFVKNGINYLSRPQVSYDLKITSYCSLMDLASLKEIMDILNKD